MRWLCAKISVLEEDLDGNEILNARLEDEFCREMKKLKKEQQRKQVNKIHLFSS